MKLIGTSIQSTEANNKRLKISQNIETCQRETEGVEFKYDSANERVMKLRAECSVPPQVVEALYLHRLREYPLSICY
jgi:hypothetical protein